MTTGAVSEAARQGESAIARILVVDDEPECVELLREFLTAKGYEVLAASRGEDAIRMVKAHRPHLALLDIRMPQMSGLEVLAHIHQIDREVGVIMVTGENEEEIGRQALALGAFDYVVKPVDLAYLERCVWHKLMTMLI